jgi:hypothetical protein
VEMIFGILVVAAAGLIMGSGAWPFKLMRSYQFEHWWFVGMLVGLVLMPWAITLLGCPDAFEGLARVPIGALVKANLFAFGWGIANVLCGLCFVRIGVALTGAILAGFGVAVGAVVPMIFKATGQFEDAPDVFSTAGLVALLGIGVMLVGVAMASLAGFGRERVLSTSQRAEGNFLGGLIMAAIAGILSTGTSFTYIYTQEYVLPNLSIVEAESRVKVVVKGDLSLSGDYAVRADGAIALGTLGEVKVGGLRANDAAGLIAEKLRARTPGVEAKVRVETGSTAADFGVFAVGLLAGAFVSIGYAVILLTRNRSWGVLLAHPGELLLAVIIGVNFSVAVALMGKGMLLLGALGGSVGWGIQQAMQMTGNQAVGFLSGEWRGVHGRPRRQMYLAIAILMVAATIMAASNKLAAS